MEPGHEDREYATQAGKIMEEATASMEPGHEDREYSPGNHARHHRRQASMEPGHEDREYHISSDYIQSRNWPQWSPVMKTGNTLNQSVSCAHSPSLNGARS